MTVSTAESEAGDARRTLLCVTGKVQLAELCLPLLYLGHKLRQESTDVVGQHFGQFIHQGSCAEALDRQGGVNRTLAEEHLLVVNSLLHLSSLKITVNF